MIADHQPGNRRLGVDTAAILVVELATGSGTRPGKRLIGGSIAGTKMKEKQNFRVHFLHTASHNYLILFIYLPVRHGRSCKLYV